MLYTSPYTVLCVNYISINPEENKLDVKFAKKKNYKEKTAGKKIGEILLLFFLILKS